MPPMTDHMELVGRLEAFEGSDDLGNGDFSILAEAAACIREMVECIDSLEAQIENIYFDLTED